jgi:dienelactone hydrolase
MLLYLLALAVAAVLATTALFAMAVDAREAANHHPFSNSGHPLPSEEVITRLGTVPTLDFRSRSGSDAGDIIAIHGMSRSSVEEMMEPAHLASGAGYRVIVPNLTQNPATKPGRMSVTDFSELMLDTYLKKLLHASSATFMGKSWGGGQVVQFALAHPEAVRQLVLIAPVGSEQESDNLRRLAGLDKRVFLVWTGGDPIMPASREAAWKTALGARLTTCEGKLGGGHIVPVDCLAQIVDWMGKS